ncbi:hypothetical protein [Streptomyces sp. NPDC046870]|uniref:hypothetical protein n=1 Tax=Streptomyces sp. NPDC046870 TaxID=3155135 RepID=UPI003456E816
MRTRQGAERGVGRAHSTADHRTAAVSLLQVTVGSAGRLLGVRLTALVDNGPDEETEGCL